MTETARQKNPVPNGDWHWADVMAAIHKREWSLRQIALAEGYTDEGSTLGGVARKPSPKAEAILASYAGMRHPMDIWPSRYDEKGNPNRRIGRAPKRGQPPLKATTARGGRNPQKAVRA